MSVSGRNQRIENDESSHTARGRASHGRISESRSRETDDGDPGAEYSDTTSNIAPTFRTEDLLLEKLSTISSALTSVVKRLDKTESRLHSVEQKLKTSSSSSESPTRMKRMVPRIVKVHAIKRAIVHYRESEALVRRPCKTYILVVCILSL